MSVLLEQGADVEAFLASEQKKGLLRLLTCGSVDDGKSTLIGRLLYDSRAVYEDHLQSIAKSGLNRSTAPLDLSLLTDGLRAEREQGITIDVAYRYFATARRKFILADTPGHEQFTRNMATGASTADLAIILIDARRGVLPQSRRHACIVELLGIRQVVVAVNKMDLMNFDAGVFHAIESEFTAVLSKIGIKGAYFLPVSAVDGDNVVSKSTRTPWFQGPALLDHLERVDLTPRAQSGFRFSVQCVIRPDLTFRGYAGQIASGVIRPGERISVWPGGRTAHVDRIVSFDGDLEEARAPQSVTLTLKEEFDIARGELFTEGGGSPHAARRFLADVVWMQDSPLKPARPWLLKHMTRTIRARSVRLVHRADISTLENEPAQSLGLNEIGEVEFEVASPIFFDTYAANRLTGALILIDPETHSTAGAGMLRGAVESTWSDVSPEERAVRYGHQAAVVRVSGRVSLARLLERRIFDQGGVAAVIDCGTTGALEALAAAGATAIVLHESAGDTLPQDDEVACEQLLELVTRHPSGGLAAEGI